MIDIKTKLKIYIDILPYGLMYENDQQSSRLFFKNGYAYFLPPDLNEDFETNQDFTIAVKILHRQNISSFLKKCLDYNRTDFLNFIDEQFLLCKNKSEECVLAWLESTHHFLVVEQNIFVFQNELIEKRGAFLKWYRDVLKTIPNKKAEAQQKLSINQIALKLVYEEVNVNKENADKIIIEYGYNSGHKLYQQFNLYNTRSNRTANPDKSKKILENKINLFKSVIDLVSDKNKIKVIDEHKILLSHLSKY